MIVANNRMKEPASLKEALEGPDMEKWLNAVEKEMESLASNDVWDMVKLPETWKAVGSSGCSNLKLVQMGPCSNTKLDLLLKGSLRSLDLIMMRNFLHLSDLNQSE